MQWEGLRSDRCTFERCVVGNLNGIITGVRDFENIFFETTFPRHSMQPPAFGNSG